jgi:hypothetical protein
MFSEATGWQDGKRLWSVGHQGDDGPKGLTEQGALPREYPPIRDRFVSLQEAEGGAEADVDFLFEIPAVLVPTLTGYKHDEPSPEFEAPGFESLSLFARRSSNAFSNDRNASPERCSSYDAISAKVQ